MSSQVEPQYGCGDNARILGLCTGALAAAAVSCSQSTLDLVPLAVCAVKVAFRTGMHATDVAQRFAPAETSAQSWSMIVAGLASAEAAVDSFCEQTVGISRSPWFFLFPQLQVVSQELILLLH